MAMLGYGRNGDGMIFMKLFDQEKQNDFQFFSKLNHTYFGIDYPCAKFQIAFQTCT